MQLGPAARLTSGDSVPSPPSPSAADYRTRYHHRPAGSRAKSSGVSARLKGRRRQVAALLLAVTAWAAGRTDIVGLVLVGSYASGRPRFGSDADLILITTHPDHYLDHDQWLTELGTAWSADPGPAVGCGHRTPGATTHRPPRGTEHRGTGMGRHPARPWNPTRAGRRLPPPARSPEHPQRCPGREARPGSHVQAVGRHGWYRSGHRAGTSGAS